MFDQAFGLPLHVLVIHAVVVLVPLTVLAALVYAVLPRSRRALRWPLLAGAVISLVSGYVAIESGEALFRHLGEPDFVRAHKDNGDLLLWVLVALTAVVVLAVLVLGEYQGSERLARSPVEARAQSGAARPIQVLVAVLLVAVAVTAGVQVVRTGDSGARAVWEGTFSE
ncbi:DUF2231 domain-containing protein [Thermasporomyces composti]|uniref:DUF2231 domain-containing protein n=1 Tax=Thermasporomyces composti TaxID=696763 RepID=A0A3D9V1U0_THECX|nr:DUF2231 domain-containing protein [Thermasporomyces composti]REF35487.1 hypothetical protein DFJ64_0867 [Thermasporomyces composti]